MKKKCLYDAYCYRFKNEDILHIFVNKYKNYKFIYKSNNKKLNNINNNIINKFIKKYIFNLFNYQIFLINLLFSYYLFHLLIH